MKRLVLTLGAILTILTVYAFTNNTTQAAGESHTFVNPPTQNRYGTRGGIGGFLEDGFHQNGIFTFSVLQPKSHTERGKLHLSRVSRGSEVDFSHALQGKVLVDCDDTDDPEMATCHYRWDAHGPLIDPTLWGVNLRMRVLFVDTEGTLRALNPDSGLDYIEFYVDGPLTGAIGYFEKPSNMSINDSAVDSFSVSVIANNATSKVILKSFPPANDTAITNYETIQSIEFGDLTARRFTHTFDLSRIDAGFYSIWADAYDESGGINLVADPANEYYPGRFSLHYDVDFDTRLKQQCEDSRQAVNSLIDSINSDFDDRYQALNKARMRLFELNARTVLDNSNLQEIETWFNESDLRLNTVADVSCEVSLSLSIDAYRNEMVARFNKLKEYKQALSSAGNSLIESSGDRSSADE